MKSRRDDAAKGHVGLTSGLGVFFRTGLAILGHGLYTKRCRFLHVLERFRVGRSPGMAVWQRGNLGITPFVIRLNHDPEDVGLQAFSFAVDRVCMGHRASRPWR